jgi:flagellar basal body-associated protein FliL
MLKKKYTFILILTFTLIIACLAGGYFYFVNINRNKSILPIYYTTPQIKVFLRDSTDKKINLTITFQVNSKSDLNLLQKRESVLQDTLYSFLCNLRLSDLQSNIISMQITAQVQKRVNIIFPGVVKETYIKEMFIE